MATNNKKLHGHVVGALVKVLAGTTHATANTSNPVAHGLTDITGAAITPANYRVFAMLNNNNEGVLYLGATPIDATNIDVMSPGTAVPYIAFIFHVADVV